MEKFLPKIVLITSNQLRHRYYAQKIANELNIVGIVAESKSATITNGQNATDAEQKIIDKHFSERNEVEKKILGENNEFPNTKVLNISYGSVNSIEVLDWISELAPDIILLYGSGIIKEPLLNLFEGKIINLHLGLSPYYRGSGTNFWPLVYNQPECVGATIHLAVREVDAGSILQQIRPDIEATDKAHDLGTKTIVKAAELIPKVVNSYLNGQIKPVEQNMKSGKLFKNKDFNAEHVQQMWLNFENGLIPNYSENKQKRDTTFPIVDNFKKNV